MRASLVVSVIAKHLNNAALELEALEGAIKPEEAVDPAIPPVILGNVAEENNEVENVSSKESGSKENCKETSGKEASKQEASKEVTSNKKPSKKVTKTEEAPKETVKAPERKLTLEIIRSECKKVIDEKGRPALAELLASFNATKTSELQEEQFVAVFEKCQTILGAGNEF